MDNLTHSLVGAAIAQAAIQYRITRATRLNAVSLANETSSHHPETSASIAMLPMFVASILANNFPDLDLFVTMFTDARLGYILHHRGHTHTLMFAPVQFVLLLGGFWLYARWKRPTWNREDWLWFAGLAWIGCFVHIAMDSWNVYGVHPFWPFNNHWYYGDFVFILEPLFWAALIPWLLASVRQRWARNSLIVFYVLGFMGWLGVYFRSWWYPLLLITVSLGFGYVVRYRLQPQARMWVSLGALACVLLMLWGSSVLARRDLTQAMHRADPQETVKDIAIMSYPSNPFCYLFTSVSFRQSDGQYVSRRGTYSFLPRWLECPNISMGQTAPLQIDPLSLPTNFGKTIGRVHRFARPMAELQKMVEDHCQVKAVMQFIRIPYWQNGDQHILIGDMRFDRRNELDLADFVFQKRPGSCPKGLPPWIAPLSTQGFW